MAKNEGPLDRWVRVVLGAVLTGVGFGAMSGGGGIALGVIGVIILLTGITGRCLIYRLINFNTLGVR
jgi:hypothetical protein